jgi:dihydrofolate reductase
MGKIVITEFLSVDGVMEAPGGDDNFVRGAWTFDFDRGDDGNAFKTGETMDADAMLLGRRTYEGFACAWPGRPGEFADRFNTIRKYVVTSTLKDPSWGETVVLGDVANDVPKVRDQHDGHLIVHGSCQLAQALLAHDLVDELRLMVFPVVLGTGKKLFGETSDKQRLKLTESRTVGPDGVLTLVYERAR